MDFVSKSELNALRKAAEGIGANLRAGEEELVFQLLRVFDYYLIANAEGHTKGEAVSVAGDGEFLCVMIDTRDPDPVSFARQNLNNFRDADLTTMCGLLETVRVSYFEAIKPKTPNIAA